MKDDRHRISVLECTLRDGGFAIEDEASYTSGVRLFGEGEREQVGLALAKANLEFIELGAIEISENDKIGFAIYNSVEEISASIPNVKGRYAALFRGPDTPIEQIPQHDDSLCECLRVIIRYSELKKSMDFCAALSRLGYKVFVQPMVTLRYTRSELDYMLDYSNDMNAFACYFVDSYGYMSSDDVKRLFCKYDKKLNPDISIGFHAHNNINLAFSNIMEFIKCESDRKILADSTCLGMGQGAGNLQTELLADYLNKKHGKNYNYGDILDACEIIEGYYNNSLWGYSVPRMLSAISHTAYKFALSLRRTYKLTYREINNILANIPEDLRHRYTPQNTVELLRLFGHEDRIR